MIFKCLNNNPHYPTIRHLNCFYILSLARIKTEKLETFVITIKI